MALDGQNADESWDLSVLATFVVDRALVWCGTATSIPTIENE